MRRCKISDTRQRFAATLLVDQSGGAWVEYVLLIAMILGAAMFSFETLGLASRGSLEANTGTVSDQHRSTSAADASAPAGTTGSVALDASSRTTTAATASQASWGVPLQFGAIVVLAVFWFLLYRRRVLQGAAPNEFGIPLPSELSNLKLFEKRQQILDVLQCDVAGLVRGRMAVRHVLSHRLKVVEPSASVDRVRALLSAEKMRHLLVCDHGRLLGVISDRDVRSRPGKTAADLMTRDPVTVAPDTLVSPAVTLMMQRRISCLPVVEEGVLLGLFTTTDVMMALQCALRLLQQITAAVGPPAERHNNDEQLATAHAAPTR